MVNFKNTLYKLSALFILVFTAAYSYIPEIAPWGMLISVSLFSTITITSPYPGNSIRGKRLYNFQILACVLMFVATYLMYIRRNEWPLLLLISALFLFYSTYVMQKEIEKESDENDNDEKS